MLYRRNCNTLLSSSLRRCYINGVCFAFQLAALWKRRSVICPWEHQLTSKFWRTKKETNEEELELGRTPHTHTIIYHLGQWKRSPPVGGMDDRVTSIPDIVDLFCSCSVSNNRAASPSSAREPISCRQSINPISRQLLVNRSSNEPGLDR